MAPTRCAASSNGTLERQGAPRQSRSLFARDRPYLAGWFAAEDFGIYYFAGSSACTLRPPKLMPTGIASRGIGIRAGLGSDMAFRLDYAQVIDSSHTSRGMRLHGALSSIARRTGTVFLLFHHQLFGQQLPVEAGLYEAHLRPCQSPTSCGGQGRGGVELLGEQYPARGIEGPKGTGRRSCPRLGTFTSALAGLGDRPIDHSSKLGSSRESRPPGVPSGCIPHPLRCSLHGIRH